MKKNPPQDTEKKRSSLMQDVLSRLRDGNTAEQAVKDILRSAMLALHHHDREHAAEQSNKIADARLCNFVDTRWEAKRAAISKSRSQR